MFLTGSGMDLLHLRHRQGDEPGRCKAQQRVVGGRVDHVHAQPALPSEAALLLSGTRGGNIQHHQHRLLIFIAIAIVTHQDALQRRTVLGQQIVPQQLGGGARQSLGCGCRGVLTLVGGIEHRVQTLHERGATGGHADFGKVAAAVEHASARARLASSNPSIRCSMVCSLTRLITVTGRA